MFKKIVSLVLAVSFVFTGVVGTSTVAAADHHSQVTTKQSFSSSMRESEMKEKQQVAPIVARIIIKAAEFAVKKLGKKIADDVWPVVKKKLDDLLESAKDLSVKGPGGGERVFAIFSDKTEIFRLDAKLLKKSDGYYLWVHYHIRPNMEDHHDIANIYMGKDKPGGW
ncbi:YpjP family protein [Brevibacillus brevis]|uniref:YpjP family protein n=1 Tax=Brevibacillus brevis TaxID=1393 RepID=UPI001C8E2F0C|nr:YpjP family protein [Brevibacillus brevis]MBY0088997.1 hypothetical protein [Brevibacillus brevis]UKK96226.1 hypothetical protein FO446_01575 [Brevibacillus brevis]